ncbi:capsular biosynthesis protein CpsI [Porphyromonas gulae]|uniref:glycosyltransferase family 2 protein n=1 Tax=Porphyromonas gulae TaxID=111105 RepID=UPI00052C6CAF|nr:glycosyltransferase family A protein [Porphyromonas gulae]KGN74585.1 capsular biosynthesis protein CpsI [Porphyromonas gulae]KGO04753.1 capsular biosynthesis protein CpsI [Porphyromonas gulae]
MKSPFFSVVIPLYNKEETISETIHSVLSQTFDNFEVIVVNDGSRDNGPSVVGKIQDPRIIMVHQENAGVSAARNKGVERALGKYIAFLDGDDKWKNNHLEELYTLITEYSGQASVFVTNFVRRFPDGEIYVNRNDLKRGIIRNYFKHCIKGSVINSSCVCIKKDVLLAIKGFNPKYSMGEDTDLWNRLARKYSIAYTPAITSIYDIDSPNNSCRQHTNYKKDASKVALKGVSWNIYDIGLSAKRYVYFLIKRAIKYKPHVRKPKNHNSMIK